MIFSSRSSPSQHSNCATYCTVVLLIASRLSFCRKHMNGLNFIFRKCVFACFGLVEPAQRFSVPPPTRGVQNLLGREPPRRFIHRLVSMFRCQLCQCVVPPHTPCQHLVVKRRSKEYPYRSRANVVVVSEPPKKRKKEYRDDPGGEGREIAKEVIVCPTCAAKNVQV
jgi:hypothetical protein